MHLTEDVIEQHRRHVPLCVEVVVRPKFANVLIRPTDEEERGNKPSKLLEG